MPPATLPASTAASSREPIRACPTNGKTQSTHPTFTKPVARNGHDTPNHSIRKKPVASVPTIAPSVFTPYSHADRRDAPTTSRATNCANSGSVAPMHVAGTSNKPAELTSRKPMINPDPASNDPYSFAYKTPIPSSIGPNRIAHSPMTNSIPTYTANGRRRSRATRPAR